MSIQKEKRMFCDWTTTKSLHGSSKTKKNSSKLFFFRTLSIAINHKLFLLPFRFKCLCGTFFLLKELVSEWERIYHLNFYFFGLRLWFFSSVLFDSKKINFQAKIKSRVREKNSTKVYDLHDAMRRQHTWMKIDVVGLKLTF